jgi:hypothetical protein
MTPMKVGSICSNDGLGFGFLILAIRQHVDELELDLSTWLGSCASLLPCSLPTRFNRKHRHIKCISQIPAFGKCISGQDIFVEFRSYVITPAILREIRSMIKTMLNPTCPI